MKLNLWIVLGLAAVSLNLSPAVACDHDQAKSDVNHSDTLKLPSTAYAETVETGMKKTVLHVKGMTCSSCATKVKAALQNLQGVKNVIVHTKEGLVDVISTQEKASTPEEMIKAVETTGFTAKI